VGLYPIALELANQECLVIGGGEIAERKADALLQAGARVTVVSPELTPNLEALARAGFVRWLPREYREGDLAGFVLAMAATDCEPVNRRVSAEARSRKIPVNVCDRPELCSFIVPAVVRQGDLILAVFTGGQSPMLARQIREQLAGQFGPEYAELLELLGGLRSRLKREIPDQGRRMEVYRRLVYSEALNLLRQGRRDQVESLAEELIRVERAGAV
jgi:siroheme synthase-like protein